jgi:hypothetical protein
MGHEIDFIRTYEVGDEISKVVLQDGFGVVKYGFYP